MENKIKVLIVDDSAFMRKLLSDFLSTNSNIVVIGTARNGSDALDKIKELQPNVVTMDVEMPIMNGIEALQKIMKEKPVPIVMISSTTKEGAENAITAIEYGAVDFIAKPSGPISLDLHKIKDDIVEKVISASKINISKLKENKFLGVVNQIPTASSKLNTKVNTKSADKKIICIGTSTGGPRALQQVLSKIPENINVPIFIVQHMPQGFTKSLANRLDSLSPIKVKEAEDGEIVQKGVAYIAPGGFHLRVKISDNILLISLDQTSSVNGHRPSVDVLFESISELKAYSKVAVVMTGMGTDGAKGIFKLKDNGNVKVIAESQETSIVFGMPKAAIATNLVDEVADVDKIAEAIIKYL